MLRQSLLVLAILWTGISLFAQNRTFDGTLNNVSNPDYGAAHTQLRRVVSHAYSNGWSTPGGQNRPNPRVISNELFAQDTLLFDKLNLSDYVWVWGQFIDHDVVLVGNDPSEPQPIMVDFQDEIFNPDGDTDNPGIIVMSRSARASGTGFHPLNPREHINEITAYIDGSGVYGSDQTRADWLRTFSGGKLKVSTGNLLPFNTVDGEFSSALDPLAPSMDNENPAVTKLFVAGDPRANENVLLLSMHTLFVREHNRLADTIAVEHPTWSDEEIFQHARKLVSGMIQAITYETWLPAMGVNIEAYSGYDDSINPQISNLFSAAAFRLGHTMLSSKIPRMDNNGDEIPQGNLTLKDAFFHPLELINGGGLDPLLKGIASTVQQDMDALVIDDIRNFLFQIPNLPHGLDLASININRGRERGIPDFNTIRADIGLPKYTAFSQLFPSNPQLTSKLEALYGDIDEIDAWVGLLSEWHMQDAILGQTLMKVLEDQFRELRDGDRFFYLNDPVLTDEEKDFITEMSLGEVILNNTGIVSIQDDVFGAMPHDSLDCNSNIPPFVSLFGNVRRENGDMIQDVTVELFDSTGNMVAGLTNVGGGYNFGNIASCANYVLRPSRNDNHRNGVSTFDLVLMSKHILGSEYLSSPYQLIAADVNDDGKVSTFDIVETRRLILFIQDEFDDNNSWRFADQDYVFDNPQNPFDENWGEVKLITNITSNLNTGFIGMKIGDLNYSASTNLMGESEQRTLDEALTLVVEDIQFQKGETYEVLVRADRINEVDGFQFTLNYDADQMDVLNVRPAALPSFGTGNFNHMKDAGAITMSWDGKADLKENEGLFVLQVKAKTSASKLCEAMTVNSRYTNAEAYTSEGKLNLSLLFNCEDKPMEVYNKFEVYQNVPNPFVDDTKIGFYMPEEAEATITITNVAGQTLARMESRFTQGYQELIMSREGLSNTDGYLFYTIETPFGSVTKKMILFDK